MMKRSRAWWVPMTVAAVVAAGAVLAVLLFGSPAKSNDYLDPASATIDGAKGLAQLLGQRGYQVDEVYSTDLAVADADSPGTTLLVTSPGLLTTGQRRQLAAASAGADLVLVEPGETSLRTLAPQAHVVKSGLAGGYSIEPSCALRGARLAGAIVTGQTSYRVSVPSTGCYPVRGHPTIVTYLAGGRTVTLIGSSLPMANAYLADGGDAALSLNLLSENRRIVWLTPQPAVATSLPPQLPGQQAPPLVSGLAWLIVLQLAIALGLAVIWRSRRFGPLIAERLPVVVRASETVEGHARLYQARRARARAAAVLREATLSRVKPLLGLPADASAVTVAGELSHRSARPGADIEAIGYGPPPASDAELVRLADDLDELEREVRSR
ncbi:MAG TPA: DUF4350 domain-containing protein [Streptosporangiaceae bacterium]|nr:DUF4350 domain-containing protein [Streptosporangiaceae bacterium]